MQKRNVLITLFLLIILGFPGNLISQGEGGTLRPRTQPRRITDTKPPIVEQDTVVQGLERRITSVEEKLAQQKEKVEPKDLSEDMKNDPVVRFAFAIFIGWILIMLIYYFWAVRYHVVNYGLSKRMWKILYPEALARTKKGKESLKRVRAAMVQRRVEEQARSADLDEDYSPVTTPFEPPKENPYKKDSFGLPPGTIRGTLALTALVMFILIEAVNLFSKYSLEGHFDGLIVALQMVLAFYFGSKAVDVLRARREEAEEKQKGAEVSEPVITTEKPLVKPEPEKEEAKPELPAERPAMVSGLSEARLINVTEVQAKPKLKARQIKAWNTKAALAERVLALTASFETGKPFPECFAVLAGNFDGQGLSFGALQWNIGQGSLQTLWRSMLQKHETVVKSVMKSKFDEFSTILYNKNKSEQLEWAKSIQFTEEVRDRRLWRIEKEWKDSLQELGKTDEMIQLQVESAQVRYDIALANCRHFELTTERGVALMFDINVQNGRVNRNGAGDRIFEDYLKIPADLSNKEKQVAKMKIVATRRAEVSHPRWRDDVENRKMTIALGQGSVHGRKYNLESHYNITLEPYV